MTLEEEGALHRLIIQLQRIPSNNSTNIQRYCTVICAVENVVCILTCPTGSSKYGTTCKNIQQYYTPKHLIQVHFFYCYFRHFVFELFQPEHKARVPVQWFIQPAYVRHVSSFCSMQQQEVYLHPTAWDTRQ